MDSLERLNLQKMVEANGAQDNTSLIQTLKHSDLIREEVGKLIKLKNDYKRLAKTNPHEFDSMCVNRCNFLFNSYTDIFNKVKKDEIDLAILWQLLNVLKCIEDGKIDQHEASFEVGKLLKKIYIDSALKKAEKLDKIHSKDVKEPVKVERKISWSEYKKNIDKITSNNN